MIHPSGKRFRLNDQIERIVFAVDGISERGMRVKGLCDFLIIQFNNRCLNKLHAIVLFQHVFQGESVIICIYKKNKKMKVIKSAVKVLVD